MPRSSFWRTSTGTASWGKSSFDAAYDGTSEVWTAILSSALTNIVVFTPIITLADEAGQIFRDLAIAIVAANILGPDRFHSRYPAPRRPVAHARADDGPAGTPTPVQAGVPGVETPQRRPALRSHLADGRRHPARRRHGGGPGLRGDVHPGVHAQDGIPAGRQSADHHRRADPAAGLRHARDHGHRAGAGEAGEADAGCFRGRLRGRPHRGAAAEILLLRGVSQSHVPVHAPEEPRPPVRRAARPAAPHG